MASLLLQNVPHLSRSRLSVPSQQSQVRREKKRRPRPSPPSAMSLGACGRGVGSTVVGREAEGGADPQPSGPALPRLTKRHYQVRRTRYEILTPLSLGIFTGKARVWASTFSYA